MIDPIEKSWAKMLDMGFTPHTLGGVTSYDKTIEVSQDKDPARARGVFRGSPTVVLSVWVMGDLYYTCAKTGETQLPYWTATTGYADPVVAVVQAELQGWGYLTWPW